MIKWKAETLYGEWFIHVYDESGYVNRILECGHDEGLAHRIARLPELEEHVARVACDAIRNYDEPQQPAKAAEAARPVDCGICSGPDCEGCSKETNRE